MTMQALHRAMEQAPGLHSLMDRLRMSQSCLQAVSTVLPDALRKQVQAGPLNDQEWCLLARSPAVSTKLRQLLPRMLHVLQQEGWDITHIRVKVQSVGDSGKTTRR